MERLFGRGKSKKSSTASNPSPSSPSNTAAVTNEEEGFSVVSNIVPPPPAPQSLYPNVNSPYPVIKPELPNGGPTTTNTQVSSGSSGSSAYLDGIPFSLSSRCSGGNELDEVLARVENIAERIRNVDWSATEYDFRLEKSVITQDITNSLNRMHAN